METLRTDRAKLFRQTTRSSERAYVQCLAETVQMNWAKHLVRFKKMVVRTTLQNPYQNVQVIITNSQIHNYYELNADIL